MANCYLGSWVGLGLKATEHQLVKNIATEMDTPLWGKKAAGFIAFKL